MFNSGFWTQPARRLPAAAAPGWLWGVPVALALLGGLGCSSSHGTAEVAATPSAGFTLAANPSGLAVPAGGSAYATITATRLHGFTGAITLSMASLPVGVVASGSIPEGGTAGLLTLVVAPEVAPKAWMDLSVHGQSGQVQGSTLLSLVIASPLPAPSLNANLVNASGGVQSNGSLVNAATALEPVNHVHATSASGVIDVRHGFLPAPGPSVP